MNIWNENYIGGGFNHFFWGNDPIWGEYVSTRVGLTPNQTNLKPNLWANSETPTPKTTCPSKFDPRKDTSVGWVIQEITLPETNMASENGWLEY